MGVLVVLATVLHGAPARGDPKEDARALLAEGLELHQKGDLEGALVRFRRAHALFPSYRVVFNIGATLADLGRPLESARTLQGFLAGGAGDAPAAVRQAARSQLERLEQQLGSVQVVSPVEGAQVFVDEQPVDRTPCARATLLAPGSYRLRVERPGHEPFALDLQLAAGRHLLVHAPLPPLDARTPASAPPAAEGRTIAAYATLGGALALLASAAALYAVAIPEGETAHDRYQAAQTEAEIAWHRDAVLGARGKLIAGHALSGLAAATLGVSIYLFATRGKGRPAERAARVDLAPKPGGALLGVSGRF